MRKELRTSSTNSSGCSNAAKWPPLSGALNQRRSVNRVRAHRSDTPRISFGNDDAPDGQVIGSMFTVLKLSQ